MTNTAAADVITAPSIATSALNNSSTSLSTTSPMIASTGTTGSQQLQLTTGLPEHFSNVDIQSLNHLIADVLTRLVMHNDQIPLTSSNLTRFHSRAPPGITISEYLRRIVKYASVERICLLILLIYIDRVCEQHRTFMISSLTVHRFVITACTIASKALCDTYLTNTMYAKVGGLSTKELNLLELEMCFLIEWNLTASAELLQQYYLRLVRQHPSCTRMPKPNSLMDNSVVALPTTPSTAPPQVPRVSIHAPQSPPLQTSLSSTAMDTSPPSRISNSRTSSSVGIE